MNIEKRVHDLYWKDNLNCARTTLICLSEIFGFEINNEVLNAAIGLHGAGGYRAQCGLVEGTLMFIGTYGKSVNKSDDEIIKLCYRFAEKFNQKFGSLNCKELRPMGFLKENPPHACEQITIEAITFSKKFIMKYI